MTPYALPKPQIDGSWYTPAAVQEAYAAGRKHSRGAYERALRDLVAGLDATHWSSWQTTARFSNELQQAHELLAAAPEPKP